MSIITFDNITFFIALFYLPFIFEPFYKMILYRDRIIFRDILRKS